MLILISTVPTAYALNRAMPASQLQQFAAASQAASAVIERNATGYNVIGNPRPAVTAYVASHEINEGTFPSLAALVRDISHKGRAVWFDCANAGGGRWQHAQRHVPRIGSHPVSHERQREHARARRDQDPERLQKLSRQRDQVHPQYWVKIAVAIALGLGTMVGWKRIVVTVGERIGKTHLTYAQGACAEITAAATIAAADGYGLPVSTTHVLSSGIAGTMAANGSGLQLSTVRNIALA